MCLLTAAQGADLDDSKIRPFLDSACLSCHDASTETPLNLEALSTELSDPETFRAWEKIYDRVRRGEMPPRSEPRPDSQELAAALGPLRSQLHENSAARQESEGRVRGRRLTRREYQYTVQDLFGIGGDIAKHLPPENETAGFDTVAGKQGISPVHIRSYLAAADVALDEAIQLGRRPQTDEVRLRYRTHPYTKMWYERPLRRGGSTVMATEDAWVTFEKRPHVSQSNHMGFRPQYPGRYRIRAEVYGYQTRTPVTLLIYRSSAEQGGASLIGVFDLHPEQTRTIDFTEYFAPQDFFYISLADADWQPDGKSVYSTSARAYKGEGVAIRWLNVQGPIVDQWPPASTRTVLGDVEYRLLPNWHSPQPKGDWAEHTRTVIRELGPNLFRRPITSDEVEAFARLAQPGINSGTQPFHDVIRGPLRAMLGSPQFLFFSESPGPLDDYALATRLSYFLWKSCPDDKLLELAKKGTLSRPEVLRQQVERMLADERSNRFINDFLDQWLDLKSIDATTPDEKLYPEYDDVLRQAMLAETRMFFRELVDADLSARNLIDSDFTFLNRRLAEHYEADLESGVELDGRMSLPSEQMRRVQLPEDSVRGGLCTHASILKVTANGTVTSPVKRGNFVLAKLLGTPPQPPPPDIGAIEPDTRGTTTIRETLDKHRNVEACASCHQVIDPPGFALESFDPIGGFRTRYRSTGKGDRTGRKLLGRDIWEYRDGLPVDASGKTAAGEPFQDIRGFRQHLMKADEQVARNLVSRLVVYATGGEVQFADRQEIERIVEETRAQQFPVRTILHKLVQSRLFTHK